MASGLLPVEIDGFVWLLLLVGPLLFLQRRLHREIQAIFLLLTHRSDIAIVLFSILFLPGVVLHESSHFLMAKILGVRTGRFSILPRPMENGRLQLGFVETGKADLVRDSLIGMAPVISGSLFLIYVSLVQLDLGTIWENTSQSISLPVLWRGLVILPGLPDFWLWFYLVFVVSSTMLPSASDRRAWLPLGLSLGLLLAVSVIAGAGPWLADHAAPILKEGLSAFSIVLGISVFVHLVLLLPVGILRITLSRLTGYQVV